MASALKDIYNKKFIADFSQWIQVHYPSFNKELFEKHVFEEIDWDEKTLKERMRHITICLHQFLPSDYQEAVNILIQVAPRLSKYELAAIVLPDFVELYGLHEWEVSIPALEVFTQYSTSEFAVRPFIIQDQEKMMKQMLKWSFHAHANVRRLASEGARPRLPWGMALQSFKKDPLPIIPILNNLKADDSLFVRKSVANNLNDISKDHPDLVLKLAREWYGDNSNTNWIIKHACRTLLKQGNSEALSIFGFNKADSIYVRDLTLGAGHVKIGEDLSFSFHITTELQEKNTIRIEHAIDYVKANGQRTRKIFKIAENSIKEGKPLTYNKKVSFKDLTTRKHYKGKHTLSILINGDVKSTLDFEVV